MTRMKLFGEPGWGSALIETQLDWYGLEYDFERVGDLFKSSAARQRLESVNPLAQIPTLVLGDGTVLTESAAITLYLADLIRSNALVPAAGDATRTTFLRWLVFLVANVYPTYTYADDPARFVEAPESQAAFKNAVTEYAKKLYSILDGQVAGQWFLGERFSALDIYVCAMTRWRPGRAWFAERTPKLFAIATATEKIPALEPAWRRNSPAA
jgi:GST-like protein